jgi:hypothetical protein
VSSPESFNNWPKIISAIYRVECDPQFHATITPLRGKGHKIELQGSRAWGGMAWKDVTPAPVVEPPPPPPVKHVLREADYAGASYAGRIDAGQHQRWGCDDRGEGGDMTPSKQALHLRAEARRCAENAEALEAEAAAKARAGAAQPGEDIRNLGISPSRRKI